MKTAVSIKLDKEVKSRAQQLAKELGFPLSTIINAQLRQFLRDQGLVLSKTPRMSYKLEKLLGPIERDIKLRKNLSQPTHALKDLDEYFESI